MAYEMVTPVHKNGVDAGSGGFAGNYRAAPDGNSLLYQALGGWGDTPTYPLGGVYLAKRGEESWSSYSAMLPMYPLPLFGSSGVPAFSPDLSKVIALTNWDFETSGEEPYQNAYLLDPVSKSREHLTVDAIPPFPINASGAGSDLTSYAGNSDFSTVFFSSPLTLTDDTVTSAGDLLGRLYRYSDGELTLESRAPDGTAIDGGLPAYIGGYSGDTGFVSLNQQPTNVLSEEGDVIYFRSQIRGSQNSAGKLYRRDLSGPTPATDLVNAEENSVEDIPSDVSMADTWFAGASADGQIAYFTSRQRLVDEDTDSTQDIFRYEHSQPVGSRLTLVSVDSEPGDAASATSDSYGVSDDGETIFFTSESQLVLGEPTAPGPKLFAFHDGELRFVALTGSRIALDEAVTGDANTSWSDNNKFFAFIADGSDITPEDNGGTLQAYRYEIATDEVRCVSCLTDGGTNTKPASWRRGVNGQIQLAPNWRPIRNVANDGTVFFQTAERLDGSDTNGRVDVYAWRDDEHDLISTGRSTDHSWLMDASSDGSTVFFLTRSKLAQWDNDDLLDVYAARVGGGLPKPGQAQEPPCDGDDCIPLPPEATEDSSCAGDDCLGAPSERPQFSDPSTGRDQGTGNPSPKPADCGSLARKAKQLQRKAKRADKRLARAGGKKAKRQAKKRARKAERRATRLERRAKNCRRGMGS